MKMSVSRQKKYLIDSFLSLIDSFSVSEQKELMDDLIDEFQKKMLSPTTLFLPAYIFNKHLGALESICKYLKEELSLSSLQISKLIKRSSSTIDISYSKAKSKFPDKFVFKESVYKIPLSIFFSSKIGVQEAIVGYLKDYYHLQFNQIAEMLERNYQTVRTAYLKYLQKGGGK